MPVPPARSIAQRARTLRQLLALTVCVLLAHALVLGGVPLTLTWLGNPPGAALQQDRTAHFVTRSLSSAAATPAQPEPLHPKPAPAIKKKIAAPARPPTGQNRPATPAQVLAADTSHARQASDTATTEPGTASDLATSETAANNTATDTAINTAASTAPVAQADAPAMGPDQAPPPAPVKDVQAEAAPAAKPVAFPAPIRLLYDGRGEERGFMKYAASAELLWLHDGAQYSARLEISAWGFRVRTWTSKGALSQAGLEPLRFGDKPRGAELATHFQRDKAIISFSANNPDVPLQDGAQDKLSALLQLSALVAGAPERYHAGDSIRFQAADAHRAEVWDFQVGSVEQLDLPGGAKQALKLSKAPTVEFDQGIEVWLAPDMQYLPVRLRITEANGAFADLLWRKTQNSE